jgi:hypothetical protein
MIIKRGRAIPVQPWHREYMILPRRRLRKQFHTLQGMVFVNRVRKKRPKWFDRISCRRSPRWMRYIGGFKGYPVIEKWWGPNPPTVSTLAVMLVVSWAVPWSPSMVAWRGEIRDTIGP